MKKAENVKEFVERIDATKKVNPKDLSSDQDLTIAIMNLISIEEHLVFSGAKTGKTSFYDLIEDVRETRKKLMMKIIPSYEGEVWCISKHLLASSMRLMEVFGVCDPTVYLYGTTNVLSPSPATRKSSVPCF